jgi:Phenazine biosynthesis-like protein
VLARGRGAPIMRVGLLSGYRCGPMTSTRVFSIASNARRQFLRGLSGSLAATLVVPTHPCDNNQARVNPKVRPSHALPFHWIDVFAEGPLAGNPLVVVPMDAGLPDDLMKRIAREFNQSETTFLLPSTRSEADRRLRSITAAGAEVFGAGHNALGAWWWLAEAGQLKLVEGQSRFQQQIGDQVLPV